MKTKGMIHIMTKKALLSYFVVVIALIGCVSYILNDQESPSNPTQNPNSTSEHAQSKLERQKHMSGLSATKIETNETQEQDVILISQDKDESTTAQDREQKNLTESTDENAIKWEDVFNSIESAEDHFVNEDGHLLKSGLDNFFKAKDINEIMDALDEVGTNEKSVSRKNKLSDYFYKEYADTTHSERFSCANKICVVTFTGDAEATESYQNLSKFSENYIFTNSKVNEYGEGVYKMLLVETDDASSLTVKSN